MQKKGISLIVLVITIIVMIILAATVVITLSNTGIIDRADQAVQVTDEKQIQQLADVAWAEAYAEGIRDREKIKEYIENKFEENNINVTKYNIIVLANGVTLKNAYSMKLMTPTDMMFNNKVLMETSEKIDLDVLESASGQIKTVFHQGKEDEDVNYFNIITGVYSFDFVDISSFVGADVTVPGIIFDSNMKIVSDLSNKLPYDDYTLIVITDEIQIGILESGEYYDTYGFWIDDWYDQGYLYNTDYVGTNGITTGIYWYTITKNGETIYDCGFLDEDFEEARKIANQVKGATNLEIKNTTRMVGFENEEYEVMAGVCLFYDNKPLLFYDYSNKKLNYEGSPFGPTTIYNIIDGNDACAIRNKETKEHVYFNYEDFTNMTFDEKLAWVNEHEFYYEIKYYATKKGAEIKFN